MNVLFLYDTCKKFCTLVDQAILSIVTHRGTLASDYDEPMQANWTVTMACTEY